MFSEDSFKDKSIIITGGGTGIGKEIARNFGKLGANLVLTSRNIDHLEKTRLDLIDDIKGEIVLITTNIKDSVQVKSLMKQTNDQFGKIDVLINNAGANFLSPAEGISDNGWDAVVDVVLKGSFICMREAFPYMKEKNYGRIINLSSTTGWTGSPYMSHSGAAKAGLSSLTKTLAVEWAKFGITVNDVSPGPVYTKGSKDRLWVNEQVVEAVKKGFPIGRFPTAEDVVGPVLFYASEYANCITGSSLAVDGGESLRYSPEFEEMVSSFINKS